MTGLVKVSLEEAVELLINRDEQKLVYFCEKNKLELNGLRRAINFVWYLDHKTSPHVKYVGLFDVDFYKVINTTEGKLMWDKQEVTNEH